MSCAASVVVKQAVRATTPRSTSVCWWERVSSLAAESVTGRDEAGENQLA